MSLPRLQGCDPGMHCMAHAVCRLCVTCFEPVQRRVINESNGARAVAAAIVQHWTPEEWCSEPLYCQSSSARRTLQRKRALLVPAESKLNYIFRKIQKMVSIVPLTTSGLPIVKSGIFRRPCRRLAAFDAIEMLKLGNMYGFILRVYTYEHSTFIKCLSPIGWRLKQVTLSRSAAVYLTHIVACFETTTI